MKIEIKGGMEKIQASPKFVRLAVAGSETVPVTSKPVITLASNTPRTTFRLAGGLSMSVASLPSPEWVAALARAMQSGSAGGGHASGL